MKLTFRQIRAFNAVAETQSFTLAAERLGLTQSAVSMLVRQLEDTLALPLFVRSGRGVFLTEFGVEARPGFARVLNELSDITDAAKGLTELRRGHLRLALSQVLATAWLPKTLAGYRAAHPGILIEIIDTVGDRVVEAVSSNEAEIGIGPERTRPPEVEAIPIWQVPIQIVLPAVSPLVTKADLTMADIAKSQWIHYSDEFSLLLERTFLSRQAGDKVQGIKVRGLIPALSLLGQGDYATAAPAYAEVFAPLLGVAFRTVPETPNWRTFMVYQRKGHALSPAAKSFYETAVARPPAGTRPIAAEC